MLTPVDIQQKRFHVGLGYDKKDVNSFFDEVVASYEQLYRSNASLKEEVATLKDTLQNYKSKEAALEKSLLLAEKDSEDTKSRANKEAKSIELEAKNKAKVILQDAEKRLENIKAEVALLETQYAAYKTNFCNLMKQQFAFLKEEDFDADAYIDEKALGVLVGASGNVVASSGSGASFGSFNGDPQMRDESTLGGMSGGSRDDLTSTSAVYTSNLSEGENFVDPFNPNKNTNGRYNPYDGANTKKSDKDKDKKQTFTVNTGKNNRNRPSRVPRQNVSPTGASSASNSGGSTSSSGTTGTSSYHASKPEPKPEVKPESKPEVKPDTKPEFSEDKKEDGPIPTLDFGDMGATDTSSSDSDFSGDVEMTINGKALLGEEESEGEETDEFGFEFI